MSYYADSPDGTKAIHTQATGPIAPELSYAAPPAQQPMFCTSCGAQKPGPYCTNCGAGETVPMRQMSPGIPQQQAPIYSPASSQQQYQYQSPPPQQHQHQHTYVAQNQMELGAGNNAPTNIMGLMDHPRVVKCTSCHRVGMTTVTYVPGTRSHIIAFLLCCLFVPLVVLPYTESMNSSKDVEHRCGGCGAMIAKWMRGGGVQPFQAV
ncbi:hypothetical protein T439DRAFT_337601 [Meredithblackwellia eburnea MCA 4105]